MNRTLKKLAIVAGSAIPAAAMLFGTASAGVSALSKVKNGAFDSNTTHWTATQAPSPVAKLTAGYGVLKVANTTYSKTATHAFAYQCIKMSDKNKVEIAGKIKILTNQTRTGSANLGLTYFPNDDCTGAPLASGFTQMVTQVGVWKQQSVVMTPPPGTESAWIRLGVAKSATPVLQQAHLPFSVYFDDIEVVAKLVKLPGGPLFPPTPTPLPHPPAPQDDDQEDPAPSPAPQDNPQQPEDPEQDPPANPQDESVPEDGETVEEDVPGPETPDVPEDGIEDPADSSGGDPSETGEDGSGSDSSGSDDGDSQGTTSDEAGGQASDTQTLGEAEANSPKKSSTDAGSPTPEAPAAGNAGIEDDGLLGTTELAAIGGFAVVGLALTFLATSRRKRRPAQAEDEDYFIE